MYIIYAMESNYSIIIHKTETEAEAVDYLYDQWFDYLTHSDTTNDSYESDQQLFFSYYSIEE